MKLFDEILASTIRIRKEIHESAKKIRNDIRKAQDKQKKTLIDAIFPTAKLKWEVLSYSITRKEKTEREESFICMAWSGPYIVSEITPTGVATLKNETVRYWR